MKRMLLCLLFGVLLSMSLQSATLSDLKNELRFTIAERDSTRSYFDDSTATIWLNLAMERIVGLGGFIPKYHDTAYVNDSNTYALPADFRAITNCYIKSSKEWRELPTGLPDTSNLFQYRISWKNQDSAELLLLTGGFEPAVQEIIFSTGTYEYALDSTFERIIGAIIKTSGDWQPILANPNFAKDTNVATYDIQYDSAKFAVLYVKYSDIFEGDTIKIFYQRMIKPGDTIRVDYLGIAASMDSNAATCEVPENLQNFIVEEAFALYYFAQKRFQEGNLIRAGIRRDMGITTNEPNR